jgi:hypothetical protein
MAQLKCVGNDPSLRLFVQPGRFTLHLLETQICIPACNQLQARLTA